MSGAALCFLVRLEGDDLGGISGRAFGALSSCDSVLPCC